MGLVLAPAVTVASDAAARDQNATGDTSKIGWLAAPVARSPEASEGNYIVVAAVSVRTIAEYDEAARVLLWINLAMAVAGTLSIWWVSYMRMHPMPKTQRRCRQHEM